MYIEQLHLSQTLNFKLIFQLPTQQTRWSTNGLKVNNPNIFWKCLSLKRCCCVIELAKRPEKLDESQSCTIFAQPRPVKVSRYLLKSYVGSAKCRPVETFRVILHPYKDKECSNTRENIVSICNWNPSTSNFILFGVVEMLQKLSLWAKGWHF